ncbi:YraN family protein [Bordetella bronchiseptica]|uniref:YraN family protein n=3 Tax=Bordetella bronchiseptica TaxID=518 RepID=UPI00028A7403|nr:YraN family protein [Bordetella bronchiseptica]KDD57341.1 TIGR00252 family protein [Bordetella bronchiseptica OSU553]AUL17357.1 YraN family protein [Bordetella bronchiseptica]AWP60593.1 YraN family protein [Bordetella bronchiseptica]AWQ07443.1 YraN family protein [Bordetella bronchiseptica]KAK54340.1 TIGR00252 family protein [Bordetella bronchiseptica OSU054]
MTDTATRLAFARAAQAQRRLHRRPPASPRASPGARGGGSPTQRRGQAYESAALRWLARQGLRPLARNLRCRAGEIDLAMRDGEVLVLVEVRARAHAGYGGAAASIGASKQGRLARAAALLLPVLLRRHWPGAPPPVRFDVVAFEAGRPHWLRGAFWLAEHAPAQGRRGQDAQGWRVR